VPGILQAQCYFVSIKGEVVATGQYVKHDNIEADSIKFEDCTPDNVPSSQINILPYGNVTLKIGDVAKFKDISIKPISIEEDSRCPSGAQCFWAGTVRVKIEIVSGAGTSMNVVNLGQAYTIEGVSILLASVTPDKSLQTQINAGDYRLNFTVIP
jgi:hypothetical protein